MQIQINDVRRRIKLLNIRRWCRYLVPPFGWIWSSIPSYLPFYLLALIASYAWYNGRQQVTVISAFQLPPKNEAQSLPFGGETVANVLRDAITAIREEAEHGSLPPPCDLGVKDQAGFPGLNVQPSTNYERPSSVTVEVKGLSVGALVSQAREVLGRETLISGDVLFDSSNSFQLIARAKSTGPWTVTSQPISLSGLKTASCSMEEKILESTDRNTWAAALIRRGKYEEVITLYKRSEESEADPDALNNIGTAKLMMGKSSEAIFSFRRAIALRRRFPKANYNLGYALDEKGRYVDAIVQYERAVELQPRFREARLALGMTWSHKGNWDRAIDEYQKAVAVEPDDARPHYLLANALAARGRHDETSREIGRAIELEPKSPQVYLGVGTALQIAGRDEEAITDFRKSIELRPDSADAHIALACIIHQRWKVSRTVVGIEDDR